MKITRVGATAVVVLLFGCWSGAAGASTTTGHAAGTVKWHAGFERYLFPWYGPFTFDGVFTSGTRIVAGQVDGGEADLNINLPGEVYGPFRVASSVPGALGGTCIAIPVRVPTPIGEGLLVLTGAQALTLQCQISLEGGAPVAVVVTLAGEATAQQGDGNRAPQITTYNGTFAG